MSFIYTQPYVVVGAFIVRENKIPLVQEIHSPDKGKWNIPAGKLDFGESPLDGAKREAFEESGIDFTLPRRYWTFIRFIVKTYQVKSTRFKSSLWVMQKGRLILNTVRQLTALSKLLITNG